MTDALRRILMLILLVLLVGCAAPGGEKLQNSEIGYRRDATNVPVSPYVNTRWHVVLAAVGNEQKVFDNFVNDFGTRLDKRKNIISVHKLSATQKDDKQILTYQEFEKSIAAIKPNAGEGCFIYLTGHGNTNGIVFSANNPKTYVQYNYMEQFLSPCAGRPTVLVFSACFSGEYMREGIARPDRIVITASDANRPSFGCGDNQTYTYFDQCFIDEWQKNTTWEKLADGIQACIKHKETTLKVAASNPQVFLGRDMRALRLPAHPDPVRNKPKTRANKIE